MSTMLSGDKAHDLFMSSEPFPLHSFLEDWQAGRTNYVPGYVIAVVCAYQHMVAQCGDGRYGGKQRLS